MIRCAALAPLGLALATGLADMATCQPVGGAAPAQRVVTDREAAARHLRQLGCVPIRDDDGRTLLRFGSALTIAVAEGNVPADASEHPLILPIADVPATRTRLRAAGLSFTELVASPSGARSLRVTDPDGHPSILRGHEDASPATLAVPLPGALNPLVLEVARRYPTDGTHRYHWPKAGAWKGCTKDLAYGGVVFAPGDPQRRAFCCGLTFEVFLDAWLLWCRRNGRAQRIADLDLKGVQRLQAQWFGSAEDRSCLHTALVDNGLGARIGSLAEARPGDFVQLWRTNGSGHSVVFLGWVREQGTIQGLRYWSTQSATAGIGERVEYFDARGGARRVLRDPLWICRVGAPPRRAERR